ncbi:microsomal triacylglycerol transfer protein isoform X2 [Hyalella azteca]|uniref:Microsomal triacylglycerol transfer protein isoform X2 n=1 Tax=Hyalella azteca TaxID=294128 RepID=A0A8B7P022_HYAAZ|nr:microsomal triacylglycerol transfer protein isoform X2 [Hyalella azteca]
MHLSFRVFFSCFVFLLFSGTLCSQAPTALSRQYEVGTAYEYSYETSVLLNEPQPKPVSSAKDVGFKLRGKVQVTPVWQHSNNPHEQLLRITVESSKLSVKARQGPTPEGFVDKSSRVDAFRNDPIFVWWSSGRINKIFSVKGEDISSVNMKKGIASILQVQTSVVEREEVDASGRCHVHYVTGDPGKIVKLKSNCIPLNLPIFYNHTNEVLGAEIRSTASVSYELRPADGVIMQATGLETHFLRVVARKTSASEVISRITLQFTGEKKTSVSSPVGATESEVIRDLSKKTKLDLEAGDLTSREDVRDCIACKSLADLVANFRSALNANNLGSQSSALAFIRLLRKMRESSEATIKAILTSKKNNKILLQLLDIVASTQTSASHKAAMGFLNFQEERKILLPERYLLTASLATHPSAESINDFFNLVKRGVSNKHLYETLVYTVASLVKTYSRMPDNADKPLIAEASSYFQEKLGNCDGTPCTMLYVSALKTLQQKQSIPLLLDVVRKAPKKAAISAMRAIQTMPSNFIDDRIIKQLEKIFFGLDRRHDSSVKIIAADMLLQHTPSEEFLKMLLLQIRDQKNKEVNTVLLSKIRDMMDKGNQEVSEVFRKVIRSPEVGNYHVLGQNGLSSAFSRPFTAGSLNAANASFSNVLEINGGLLKRSTVDVFVRNHNESMRLLSFGMFAGGLDMFGGGSEDDDVTEEDQQEVEDANAGIEITLMDTQLRPYVFFTSKSELMGHVWSGTASERTTALQGSALLHDHLQRVPLQNGFTIEMLLTGSISYDFAGQVQISLWNQNAHSLVEIGAGMIIQGQARVDTSFVQTMIEFNTGVQTRLDFVSDLEFGSGVAMCMQMSQPNYEIIENVRKLERIPGSNYVLRKYKKRTIPGPGKTYVMNKKNSLLCNKMFGSEER